MKIKPSILAVGFISAGGEIEGERDDRVAQGDSYGSTAGQEFESQNSERFVCRFTLREWLSLPSV